MQRHWRARLLLASLTFSFAHAAAGPATSELRAATPQRAITSPRDALGFTPGDDRKLAAWSQFVDYFQRLDRESDRLRLFELGKTTLGKPFLLAVISSPANLARLDRLREIQRQLADPRSFNSSDDTAEKLIAEGRTIVMITCGIHSTEVGANLVSMNIAYRLASDDSPETREILDQCVVLLVPSLNPDGVDIVKTWYDKTLGTPAEGTGPPELYHHYVGHDNNRDWYAFTQVETQLTVDRVHNEWHPQIVHDIHQQSPNGSRFFLPPFLDPWEPNVPPLIQAGVNFMGSSMARDLIAQGKTGVVINAIYDAWTPARAYQHYHGGIRILSETASASLASPINVPFERQSPQINLDPKVRSWNYPAVWPGGEWKLANIVDYMQSGAFALLRNAAKFREHWIRSFYLIGKDAVRPRREGEPFAFLLREPQPGTADYEWRINGLRRLESILRRGQVEVIESIAAFDAALATYPKGTRVVPMSQPYGGFAKALLERQQYPDLREYPGGPPRRPYDVTAHTLPLLMGVEVVEVNQPFEMPDAATTPRPLAVDSRIWPSLASSTKPRVALYKGYAASMDEGWTRWILEQYGLPFSSLPDAEVRDGNLKARFDCILIPDQAAGQIVNGLPRTRYPEEYSGGIGEAGVQALKEFVSRGGTLVTFNNACELAFGHLGAPVRNALKGATNRDFFCPGSILKIDFDPAESLARGVPMFGRAAQRGSAMAWFERGPALEPTGPEARVVARFSDANDLLLSGWLLGGDRLAGKGAIVEVRMGEGRIIMFAFRPQYRGQSVATLPFVFNAVLNSATGG